MIPIAADPDPNATPAFDPLVALSRKASGTPHPAVLSLEPPTADAKLSALSRENDKDWTLATKIGDTSIAIILVGKAEA